MNKKRIENKTRMLKSTSTFGKKAEWHGIHVLLAHNKTNLQSSNATIASLEMLIVHTKKNNYYNPL